MSQKGFPFLFFLLFWTSVTMAGETKVFHAAQYGETWPFTVDQGTVSCLEGKVVVFTSGGKQYALNGVAERLGYAKINSIWKPDLAKVERLKEIAEAKEMSPKQSNIFMTPPPKMDLDPLIIAGLKRCQ